MELYFQPIKIALLVFPFLALLITVPYLLQQYHKYGAVPVLRSVIVYTFILYLLSAFFLVILPLPSREAVMLMPTKVPQLIPLQFLKDIITHCTIDFTDFHSYLAFFQQPEVYTVLFNLVLTIPFGIYLRYYFKKKWYHVAMLSFLLSLFFEVTQLTGLYGIYPKAYRLFDIDDLLMNTLGGLLGFCLTPLVTHFFPTREELDEVSYKRGRSVSIYRRGVAFLVDSFFYLFLIVISSLLFSSISTASVVITISYFCLLPAFTGVTVGKLLVRLKLCGTGQRFSHLLTFVRQLLLYFVVLPGPFLALWLFSFTSDFSFVHFICLFLGILVR